MSPTTSFAPRTFNSPTTTFAVSHQHRSSSVSLSPTTPREAQTLLSPAPRAVSPFLMIGLNNSNGGTPPTTSNSPLPNPNSTPFGQDMLPLPDETQARFNQASWQYAPGLDVFRLGRGGRVERSGYARIWVWYGCERVRGRWHLGRKERVEPESPDFGRYAGGYARRVARSWVRVTRAEWEFGWFERKSTRGLGYWERLVDAIVNQQGIGGRE